MKIAQASAPRAYGVRHPTGASASINIARTQSYTYKTLSEARAIRFTKAELGQYKSQLTTYWERRSPLMTVMARFFLVIRRCSVIEARVTATIYNTQWSHSTHY